jgi:hypothetical protein
MEGIPDSGTSVFKDGGTVFWSNDPSVAFYSISWMTESVKKAGVKNTDFVSGYAASDAFEDLAETVVYYVFHQENFKQRAKTNKAMAAKLKWVETYMFPSGLSIAKGNEKWNGKDVPWDITKLSYEWRGTDTKLALK